MKTFFSRMTMILTLKCDQASLLMSDSLDRKLTFHERLALKGHLLACRVCPKLLEQIRLIHSAAQRPEVGTDESDVSSAPSLSPGAKDRMKRLIRDANTDAS